MLTDISRQSTASIFRTRSKRIGTSKALTRLQVETGASYSQGRAGRNVDETWTDRGMRWGSYTAVQFVEAGRRFGGV
jgi:hypothetical protein